MRKAAELLLGHPINKKREAEGKLPANCIWFWAEARARALPNFPARFGADGGVISAVLRSATALPASWAFEPVSVPPPHRRVGHRLRGQDRRGFDVPRSTTSPPSTSKARTRPRTITTWSKDLQRRVPLRARGEAPRAPPCASGGEGLPAAHPPDHRTFMANGAHGGTPVPYMIYDSREMGPASGLRLHGEERRVRPLP